MEHIDVITNPNILETEFIFSDGKFKVIDLIKYLENKNSQEISLVKPIIEKYIIKEFNNNIIILYERSTSEFMNDINLILNLNQKLLNHIESNNIYKL